MVRPMFPGHGAMQGRPRARVVPMLVASLSFAAAGLGASGSARAAMNFCAAPALQASETTQAEPGIQALIRSVDARIGEQPKAMARVHTEGTLPHEGIYDQSAAALKDLDLMRDAALAWRVTNAPRYLQLVDRFLSAWVATYQPSFNPIDETRFESLIVAYDMTASALPVKTRNATAAFIAKLGAGYVAQIDAQKRPLMGAWRNNWQSHRIKLIALSAFTLGDRKMMNAAQRLFVEHLADNIGPDGKTWDFEERDALHYAVYDLQPLVTAALAARRFNRNWLRERARTARRSRPRSTGSCRTRSAKNARGIREFAGAVRREAPRGRPAGLHGAVGPEKRHRTLSSGRAARRALCPRRAAAFPNAARMARRVPAIAGALALFLKQGRNHYGSQRL